MSYNAATRMIPYIHVPDLGVVHPFGLLVATGVLIGTALATRRARKLGFDLDQLNSFITWMLVVGFIGGHMLDEIFYHPKEIAAEPWSLLMLWRGLSSFGGFTGALLGIVLWKYFYFESKYPDSQWMGWIGSFHRRKEAAPILPFADLILSVFPVAWAFGRSGCSSVHDHPGALATKDSPFAVGFARGFPPDASPEYVAKHFTGLRTHLGPIEFLHGQVPRYDLGLLELMFTIVLATLIALTWRKKVPTGTYVVVTSLAYAPVRFAMDFLRITEGPNADLRYGGLTPAQWACIALFVFGLAMLGLVLHLRAKGTDPALKVLGPHLEVTEGGLVTAAPARAAAPAKAAPAKKADAKAAGADEEEDEESDDEEDEESDEEASDEEDEKPASADEKKEAESKEDDDEGAEPEKA